MNDPQVNQTQNILGERQGKINSNIDEVNTEKIIIISQATPIHCSNQGRKEGRFKLQSKLLRGIVKLLVAARSVVQGLKQSL